MSTQDRIITWVTEQQAEKGNIVEVTPETDLLASGLLDSLDFLHLMTFIEEELNVDVPVEQLSPDNFSTPAIAGALVDSILAGE